MERPGSARLAVVLQLVPFHKLLTLLFVILLSVINSYAVALFFIENATPCSSRQITQTAFVACRGPNSRAFLPSSFLSQSY